MLYDSALRLVIQTARQWQNVFSPICGQTKARSHKMPILLFLARRLFLYLLYFLKRYTSAHAPTTYIIVTIHYIYIYIYTPTPTHTHMIGNMSVDIVTVCGGGGSEFSPRKEQPLYFKKPWSPAILPPNGYLGVLSWTSNSWSVNPNTPPTPI